MKVKISATSFQQLFRVSVVTAVLVATGGTAALADPVVLVPAGSGGWKYQEVPWDLGLDPGFAAVGFDDSLWATGTAPFGDEDPASCPVIVPIITPWSLFTDLLLRRHFNLLGCESSLQVRLAVDNDAQVYFNGVDVSGGLVMAEGCATYYSLTFAVPDALVAVGDNVLAVRARDRGIVSFLDLEVQGDVPPEGCGQEPPPIDCSGAAPSVGELWPPNHKYRSIEVTGVVDGDGNPVEITIDSIFQDEPVLDTGQGSGHTCPDGTGLGGSTASVRAERSGLGTGRVYHIGFTAEADDGSTCTGEVRVCVPHDQRPGHICVDEGALFDSTVCP